MLNSSACSRSDLGKCPATSLVSAANRFPPQYSAIFVDNHHLNGSSESVNVQLRRQLSGQLSEHLLTGNVSTTSYLQYLQYCQSPQVMHSLGLGLGQQHQAHLVHHVPRTIFDVGVPLAGNSAHVGNYMASTSIHLPVVPVSSGDLSRENAIRKCFQRPSLPFVIGILALGGVACTLGGIVLGSTGLIEHSTQYLSAALLMIGIGVSLLVISGAVWRLSLPDDVDDCLCFRQTETCRHCNSPHCHNRVLPESFLHTEFQNRQPPPSYLTSLNEYALVYHHSTAAIVAHTPLRLNTPPPLYSSTYSLNTSTTIDPSERHYFLRTNEFNAGNQAAAVYTREDVSDTSYKDIIIDEAPAAESAGRLS
ncbi:uncharacterized protein LOC128256372 [Drosophila gunungcola]|uniref:uncharacterized protein LOC128256372 n=1 Tax=Drosophila gunungcola TaxID=103775 RepID=UPI0022E05555|nr:uncharacterized protein LOC128256372 [Drosophila gunungcola]